MGAVGRRYAQALFSTLGGAAPDRVLGDLQTFGGWMEEVPALRVAIENPGIPQEVKAEIVQKLGREAGLEDVSVRFVLMVVANRRVRQWGDFVSAYQGLCDDRRGVVRARISTARPMAPGAAEALGKRLAEILGHKVEIQSSVSPDLLGGVELRVGSTVYDGSVAGALKSLHQSLVKG